MTDCIVLLRNVVRIPYYHAGIGSTLIKPERGEGTFSATEIRVSVSAVEERLFDGRSIRAVEVKGHPMMIGAWLDVDATPGLREHLRLPERPALPAPATRLIL